MFTLNKNGIILDVNLTGALLLGVEEGNLRNQAFIKYIDPDYHQKFHIHCLKAKKTNKKQILDVKLLTKNNDAVYVHLETISVTNETQELQEFQVTMVDITEQEKASKEIEFANKYNRSLIEASLDPLVTIGADGMITDLNKCTEKITGYSRDELIGTNFLDYITEPEKVQEEYPRLFDVGSVKDYPLEIKNKNGNLTPVLYNASVYKDEKGNVIGVFAAARDITQIKNTTAKITGISG